MPFPDFYGQIDASESQERVGQEGIGLQNDEVSQFHTYFFKIGTYNHSAKIVI